MLALSLSTLGINNKPSASERMKETGFGLYGNALRDAVAMLRNPQKRQANELLAVVRLLNLFEVYTPCRTGYKLVTQHHDVC